MASLKEQFEEKMLPAIQKELGLKNRMEVPRISKIVINVGLGDGALNAKLMDAGVNELATITGQKAVITRAKKSVAGFKVRENMPVGAKVTLRGKRMYNFLAKVIGIVLPRVRDFRGLSEKGFDGRGNYNIGIKDQLVFPEIQYDKVERLRGMNITLVTTAQDDIQAKALMQALGFPFRKITAKSTPSAKEAAPATEAS